MTLLSEYRRTRAQLASEALLLGRDPNGERFTAARVAEKLNDACLEYALRTQIIKDEINIQIKANVFEYDIKNRIETDGTKREFGMPLRLGYNGNDDAGVWPTTALRLDLKRDYIRQGKMKPTFFYICAVAPGKLQILGILTTDGEALPSEENNLQVAYVGLPVYMSTAASYPDTQIPAYFHEAIPYKAVSFLLEEGDEEALQLADFYDQKFNSWIYEAVVESYRGNTAFDSFRPL